MGLNDAQKFTIRSTLELPSDEFTVDMSTTKTYRGAIPDEAVRLRIGLNVAGTPHKVTALDGLIDRYAIQVTPNAVTSAATGRDNIAKLLGRVFKKRYLKATPDPEPEEPFVVGTFLASFVAREAVESVGLDLSWECPDYTLKGDVTLTGRIIDSIISLLAPWRVTDMFKTDVFVRGTSVFCRQRQGVFPGADLTFSAAELRHGTIGIEKVRLPKIGKITILGELHDPGAEDGFGGAGIVRIGEIERRKEERAFNPDGSLKTLTITVATLQLPEETELRVRTQTFVPTAVGDKLIKDLNIEHEFNRGTYDAAGRRINPMVKKREDHVVKSVPEDEEGEPVIGGTLAITEKKKIAFAYDDDGLQVLSDETTEKKDEDGDLVPFSRVVVRKDDTSPGVVKEITDEYEVMIKEITAGGVVVRKEVGDLLLKKSTVQENPGQRPGYLVSSPPVSNTQIAGRQIPRVLEEVVSTDADAIDVRFSNQHLDIQSMQKVLDQIKQQSGIWRVDIRTRGVAIPFARKGQVLKITGIVDGEGVAITLQNALIVEQAFQYNEASGTPSSIMALTAVYWSQTP